MSVPLFNPINNLFVETQRIEHLLSILDYGGDPNFMIPGYGWTPLDMACRDDDISRVQLLLSRGAQPSSRTLSCTKSVKVAQLIVNEGADVRMRSDYHNTLLHIACLHNNAELVQFYLGQGLSLEETNEFGQTPVHFACMRLVTIPQTAPLQSITNLPHGAPQPKREKLPTMLSGAPRSFNADILRLFSGGNFRGPDSLGYTPFDYAQASGWKDQIEELFYGKKYAAHEIFQTLREGKNATAIDYLEKGGDPNIIEGCATLAHIAAIIGDEVFISELLKRPNTKIDEKLTPVKFSMEAFYGKTPLFCVCDMMSSIQREEAMKRLIEGGADVNSLCIGNSTPFLRLCETGHSSAIRTMVHQGFSQLMKGKILPGESVDHQEVGNKALQRLCQIYLEDKNSVESIQKSEEELLAAYQRAQLLRKEALESFERICKASSSNQSIDLGLQHYLESSKQCQLARSTMIGAQNKLMQLTEYCRCAEYRNSQLQIRNVIERLMTLVIPTSDVKTILDKIGINEN